MNIERLERLRTILATGRYAVDINRGEVRNKTTNRILGSLGSYGYLRTTFRGNNLKEEFRIHEIIAVVADLNIEGLTVNHLDGDKLNNSITNLEAITILENIKHARDILGVHEKRRKLTWEAVDAIRSEYGSSGITQHALAIKYGVHHQTISKIVTFKYWNRDQYGQPISQGVTAQ